MFYCFIQYTTNVSTCIWPPPHFSWTGASLPSMLDGETIDLTVKQLTNQHWKLIFASVFLCFIIGGKNIDINFETRLEGSFTSWEINKLLDQVKVGEGDVRVSRCPPPLIPRLVSLIWPNPPPPNQPTKNNQHLS